MDDAAAGLTWAGTWLGSFPLDNTRTTTATTSQSVCEASPSTFKLQLRKVAKRKRGDDGGSVSLTGVWTGWYNMDGCEYRDHRHELLQDPIVGPDKDGPTLVVAKGNTEFGRFVSTGSYDRRSRMLVLHRRYVQDDDPRTNLTLPSVLEQHRLLQAHDVVTGAR